MNKKAATIVVTVVLFAALIIAALAAYNRYSETKEPSVVPTAAPVATATAQTGEQDQDADVTPEPEQAENGRTAAPDITLKTLDGRTVSLSDYKGKQGVVLNFWASWCPPCRSEMSDFNEQAEALGEDKVVFLMVNLTDGSRETEKTAKEYLTSQKFTFKNVLLDSEFKASDAYAVSGIPTTYFIDIDGNIAAYHIGALAQSDLKEGIALITP